MQDTPGDSSVFDIPFWMETTQEQMHFDGADLMGLDDSNYVGEQIDTDPSVLAPLEDVQLSGIPPFMSEPNFDLSRLSAFNSNTSYHDTQMSIDPHLAIETASKTNGLVPDPAPQRKRSETAPTRTKRRRKSQSSEKTGKKRKSTRTFISPAAQEILEQHFGINPYPSESELEMLASEVNLSIETTKNWFSNNRSRKKTTIATPSLIDDLRRRSVSSISSVTAISLEALESHSPARSTNSIERYIMAPQSEEPVPELAIQEAIGTSSTHFFRVPSSAHPNSSARAYSSAGSGSSCNSASSRGSVKSYDSRGSRRGRMTWNRLPSHMDVSADKFFCTEPSCMQSFRFQSAWTRHEEAVHYCPYHWVCCLRIPNIMRLPHCFICSEKDILITHFSEFHFQACALKKQEDRTFLREDQLKQHVANHLGKETPPRLIPKNLLSAWKTSNWKASDAFLKCGFCGDSFGTWTQRTSHVSAHIQRGICKLAWWPERLPDGLGHNKTVSRSRNVREGSDTLVAIWSCRFLHDPHSIFEVAEWNGVYDRYFQSTCVLCGFTEIQSNPGKEYYETLVEHAEIHRLRACTQAIFTNPKDLAKHLELDHRADRPLANDPKLLSWKLVDTDESLSSNEMLPSRCGDICRHLAKGDEVPVQYFPSDIKDILSRNSVESSVGQTQDLGLDSTV
ncbi:homeobox and C2H2 transcription factor [Pyrenophora seminiperda CCB06]|uniref:Homeobox and C2H2 transcription factor n=1 Tax=Pyrenophora seminiperda CCB06 TaxID=1302712 RepID=A0A3M7M831_9PLEO|nr:homeobox and C2H2 transcription factor [Pyrenophora seminiperda CCB06]